MSSMTDVPRLGPFCREIDDIVCTPCPVREITEGQWQVDARPGVTPFDVSEDLVKTVYGAVYPETPGSGESAEEAAKYAVAQAMQEVHTDILIIAPDSVVADIGFHPNDEGGLVIVANKDLDALGPDEETPEAPEIIGEEDFPRSAATFLACIRRNCEAPCIEGVPPRPSRPPIEDPTFPRHILDLELTTDVLQTLADEGSTEDMRAKLKGLTGVIRSIDGDTLTHKKIDAMDDIDLRRSLRSVAEYLQEIQARRETEES